MTNDYEQQAQAFLDATGAKLTITLVPAYAQQEPLWEGKHGHEYRIKLERNDKRYIFSFWDSYHNMQVGKRPTVYSVLACLDSNSYTDLQDFCQEFGYTIDNLDQAQKTYVAVNEQSKELRKLFTHAELEQLEAIA